MEWMWCLLSIKYNTFSKIFITLCCHFDALSVADNVHQYKLLSMITHRTSSHSPQYTVHLFETWPSDMSRTPARFTQKCVSKGSRVCRRVLQQITFGLLG